jgi:hypothetical protein
MIFKAKVDMTGRGTIFLDDKDISMNVSAFKIGCSVNKPNIVQVTLFGPDLDIEIEGEINTVDSGVLE